MTAPAPERPSRSVGGGFIATYAIAQIGAYLSFVPLLQILTPLKAAALDPAGKTVLLSSVAFWGAITASVANLAAGAISDRTTSRFGRRRPWLVVGLVGAVLSYWLIYRASTPLALLLGVVAFQLAFNFMFAALGALIPDQAPDRQKGKVSAFAGLGFPIGTVLGTAMVGRVFSGEFERFAALSVVVVLTLLPLILTLKDPPIRAEDAPPRRWSQLLRSLWVDPRAHPDFAIAWGGRCLVVLANSLVQGFVLFYLQDAVHYSKVFPGHTAEEGLTVLTAISCATNVTAALAAGFVSDRLGRRKPFILLGALMLAASLASFAMARTWSGIIGAYLLYGAGTGCFYATDLALVAQVLPRVRDAGKDLGIVNLSNTLPQALAPLLAVSMLGPTHADYRTLFLTAAAVAAIGGLIVQLVRRVR